MEDVIAKMPHSEYETMEALQALEEAIKLTKKQLSYNEKYKRCILTTTIKKGNYTVSIDISAPIRGIDGIAPVKSY